MSFTPRQRDHARNLKTPLTEREPLFAVDSLALMNLLEREYGEAIDVITQVGSRITRSKLRSFSGVLSVTPVDGSPYNITLASARERLLDTLAQAAEQDQALVQGAVNLPHAAALGLEATQALLSAELPTHRALAAALDGGPPALLHHQQGKKLHWLLVFRHDGTLFTASSPKLTELAAEARAFRELTG